MTGLTILVFVTKKIALDIAFGTDQYVKTGGVFIAVLQAQFLGRTGERAGVY
jgi:hypothetical protein